MIHSVSMPEMRDVSARGEDLMGQAHSDLMGSAGFLLKREKSQRRLRTVPVVMFADDVHVHQIESPADEEKEQRWYSTGEYFFFKKEALNTVRRMSNSHVAESDSITTRGLEIVESEALRRRKQTISSAVRAVLNEKGADPEAIAEVYKNATSRSVELSIEAGANDAKDAETILKDVRKDLEKNPSSKWKKPRNVVPLLSWLVKRRTER